MKLGIKKISNVDSFKIREAFHTIQDLCEKYNLEAEMKIYDVCDADSSEEVHNPGKKMARVLRKTGLPQMDHSIGAWKKRFRTLANPVQGEKL